MVLNLRPYLVLLGISVLCTACGGRAYVYEPVASTEIQNRLESQSDKTVRVSAVVPGREETEAIFGIALYDQGIQPVWLEIENTGPEHVRYAMVSTDPEYFSPLEVAYKNRGGYSDEARIEMERRFYGLTIPRYIASGETRSGFVFTHADNGAKGINVDVFSSDESFHFTFLLRVPGFVPDYANIEFDSIYSTDQLTEVSEDNLYGAIKDLPCCSADEDGDSSIGAINIVLVGAGDELLRALLRSRWVETSAAQAAGKESRFLFGRQQDAIFRHNSGVDNSSYEIRLWLAPILSGTDRVWLGEVTHIFGSKASLVRMDPDVDYARHFTLQSLAYGQAVEKFGWVNGTEIVPAASFWEDFIQTAFFSDGGRAVFWLSGEPMSVADITTMDWDNVPDLIR
jgi:hypothetical protein